MTSSQCVWKLLWKIYEVCKPGTRQEKISFIVKDNPKMIFIWKEMKRLRLDFQVMFIANNAWIFSASLSPTAFGDREKQTWWSELVREQISLW